MAKTATISDAEILEEVVSPENGRFTPEAARALLEIKFRPAAVKRIQLLLRKNNRGAISSEERMTLEKYLRIGKFIDLLHAKARYSLTLAEVPQ